MPCLAQTDTLSKRAMDIIVRYSGMMYRDLNGKTLFYNGKLIQDNSHFPFEMINGELTLVVGIKPRRAKRCAIENTEIDLNSKPPYREAFIVCLFSPLSFCGNEYVFIEIFRMSKLTSIHRKGWIITSNQEYIFNKMRVYDFLVEFRQGKATRLLGHIQHGGNKKSEKTIKELDLSVLAN